MKVTQFSVWWVLTKVKKAAEGRASEDRLARASMSATWPAKMSSDSDGSGICTAQSTQ